MKNSVKIITGLLGFGILIPGIAKFFEPFKTFIYKHQLKQKIDKK